MLHFCCFANTKMTVQLFCFTRKKNFIYSAGSASKQQWILLHFKQFWSNCSSHIFLMHLMNSYWENQPESSNANKIANLFDIKFCFNWRLQKNCYFYFCFVFVLWCCRIAKLLSLYWERCHIGNKIDVTFALLLVVKRFLSKLFNSLPLY